MKFRCAAGHQNPGLRIGAIGRADGMAQVPDGVFGNGTGIYQNVFGVLRAFVLQQPQCGPGFSNGLAFVLVAAAAQGDYAEMGKALKRKKRLLCRQCVLVWLMFLQYGRTQINIREIAESKGQRSSPDGVSRPVYVPLSPTRVRLPSASAIPTTVRDTPSR